MAAAEWVRAVAVMEEEAMEVVKAAVAMAAA
jgi:hypothetical protein